MNYEIIKIDEKTWRIEESGVRFFLLTGTKKALLIDSGMTVHNAKEIAKTLTDLPVELLNTHADIDHTGSNDEFDIVYMNPAELYNCKKDITINPIWDGDIIDLGERRIRVITQPGHTPGSVALLDVENRILYSGDSIQDGRIFMFGSHRNIRAYLLSLRKIKNLSDKFDMIYPSHGTIPLGTDILDKLIEGTERVISGDITPQSTEFHGITLNLFDMGAAMLLCDI